MMARSKCSNQRPNTLMQDRSPPARRNHLQRTAGPYIWVKPGRTQSEQMSSGLPLKADITRCMRHVSNVPATDSCTAANSVYYSITSSAKADNDGGMVRCNNLAVRMLIRNDR